LNSEIVAAFDCANLEVFDFGDIPDSEFVMTTWHENEPLLEDCWFAKEAAHHPTVKLDNTLVLQGSPFAIENPPAWSLVPNLLRHRQSSKVSGRQRILRLHADEFFHCHHDLAHMLTRMPGRAFQHLMERLLAEIGFDDGIA